MGGSVGLWTGVELLTGVFKGCCGAVATGVSVAGEGANCAASGSALSATAMAKISSRSAKPNRRQPAIVRWWRTRYNGIFCPERSAFKPNRMHTSVPIPAMIGINWMMTLIIIGRLH